MKPVVISVGGIRGDFYSLPFPLPFIIEITVNTQCPGWSLAPQSHSLGVSPRAPAQQP